MQYPLFRHGENVYYNGLPGGSEHATVVTTNDSEECPSIKIHLTKYGMNVSAAKENVIAARWS